MRFTRASLGLKLNLVLLLFFVILGGATAALIFAGFAETQDNADERSREALEVQGKVSLLAFAAGATEGGDLRFEAAAAIGQRAAGYLQLFKAAGASVADNLARFVQTPNGVWYDPDPDRISDVVVPNNVARLEGAVLDDIEYSAALDALLPALLDPYPGELIEEAYHPIAIIFIGTNGVGRYYPPIGIHETTPADFDASYLVDKFGPAPNPERKTIWTTPYEDLNGRGLVITAQTPIYEGDVFRGIFEVDLSISKLVDQIAEIQPTESGFAFYLDSEGEVLRPGANEILLREVDSGQNDSLAALLTAMANLGSEDISVEEVRLEGREFFVAFAAMRTIGGSFAVAAPVDEVTAQAALITGEIGTQADRTMLLVLGSMTALFAAALVGATYLNRQTLVRPIEALVAGTRSVAEGEFETRIAVHGSDELAALGKSFNQMTSDIQREVRDREAAQEELAALFASMSDMVFTVDREGHFLRVAETNSPMRYTMPHGAAGQSLYDVMPRAVVDPILDSIRTALRDRTTVTIEFAREADGRTEWHSAAISPLSDTAIVAVVRDITDRVNARQDLERQVEERTRELTALLRISNDVASTLELGPLLSLVIEQVATVVDSDLCSIFTLENGRFIPLDPDNPMAFDSIGLGFSADMIEPIGSRILRRETVIIEDVRSDSEEALAYGRSSGALATNAPGDIHSWMALPLALKDRVIGMMTLAHRRAAYYTERHAGLVGAIASQVAVAIENARLYEQAQQFAAVEERQRLARELHDSVSQALYGIALSATAAQTLIGDDESPARQRIDFVMTQAQAAMAEMRALIFELRPESLAEEGLIAALRKQSDATEARYGIRVVTQFSAEPTLSLAEKEVFYRIAQEALHNVVKHAHASEAKMSLLSDNGSIVLEVSDDGTGFDAGSSFPGHIGLVSMRTRAAAIGGSFEIESEPDSGTRVTLSLPAR